MDLYEKEIEGFENLYSVTNTGKIVSKNYLNKGITKELKPQDNGNGYLYVVLQKDKKRFKKYVHRIVANAFIGFSKLEVNHKDLNKKNNNIKNLEYVTKSENHRHANQKRPRTRNGKGQFTKS